MPSSKKPRKPHKIKPQSITKNTGVASVFSHISSIGDGQRKRNVRNKIMAHLIAFEEGRATKQDMLEVQRMGTLYEAMCRAGFGELDVDLCIDFDNACTDSIKNAGNTDKYYFSDKQWQDVLVVKQNFNTQMNVISEQSFFDLDYKLIVENMIDMSKSDNQKRQ